jgi:hypothetical protein
MMEIIVSSLACAVLGESFYIFSIYLRKLFMKRKKSKLQAILESSNYRCAEDRETGVLTLFVSNIEEVMGVQKVLEKHGMAEFHSLRLYFPDTPFGDY